MKAKKKKKKFKKDNKHDGKAPGSHQIALAHLLN